MEVSTQIKLPRSPRFAAIVPVGPSPAEHRRLLELLDSIWWHEPQVARIVLVDDFAGVRDLPAPPHGAAPIDRILNPRNGRGQPVTGGLCAAMLAALHHCATELTPSIDFVVKLDTDALVIAPFAAKLSRLFSDHPAVGMAGAYLHTPNGEARDFREWATVINDLASPWIASPDRRRRAGRTLPFPTNTSQRAMRQQVRDALQRGYVAGENILGGSYAVAGTAISAMHTLGMLRDPLLWLHTCLGEDVLVSMLVRSVGMQLAGFCNDGEVFGVRYQGLADSPARLVERGYSIIHSTKNDPRFSEGEIRDFFARRRKLAALTNAS